MYSRNRFNKVLLENCFIKLTNKSKENTLKVLGMSKDQGLGVLIFLICVVLALGYIASLFAPNLLMGLLGISIAMETLRFWLIAIPVLIAFIAIMFIGAWIGWTMATTPPPKPIEELEKEASAKELQ